VRIWCCKTGECLSIFPIRSVCAIKFDERFLVTGTLDRKAISWDVRTGDQLKRYTGHISAVLFVDFDARLDFLVTGSPDTTLKLWSLSTGVLIAVFKHPFVSRLIRSVRLFCDANWQDRFSVLVSDDYSVYCWVVDVSSATALTFQVLFESFLVNRVLIGFEFKGSFLTIVSQTSKTYSSLHRMIETSYEFTGFRFGITESHTFSLSKDVQLLSYLGGGKCFSVSLAYSGGDTALYITRSNVEIPPVLVKFPLEYR